METTTRRPPTSGGDGPGEGNVGKRAKEQSESRPAENRPSASPSSESRPPEKAELLGGDGQPIPIGKGFKEDTLDRGRELGRRAGESWKRLSKAAETAAGRNPTRAALTAFGVGIVAGVVVGALFSRD